ncbi:LLM class flavin-dependent oxidoreductase [Roseomonas sp. 18066]|uniref:LLM class flavin-dependent oxidoreductase n=1 Tax=Roseomonas sp. 18066 TaxID=2681412 RepID=UPI00135AC80E|nr:LLM class flavin-dependent oxidoreductase [Roseomonas sp. 18066]
MRIALGLEAAQPGLLPLLADPGLLAAIDATAELLTLADGFAQPGADGPDALLLANWLGARSRQVGILPGVAVNFLEPFHVSTGIATLDHVTEGRAGLLVQPLRGARPAQARRAIGPLPGFPEPEAAALAADTAEAIAVIRALWDSWQDDAIIRDPVSQRFVDAERLHYIRFQGQRFSVLGPSITPRPPQGQPVVAIDLQASDDPAQAAGAELVFLGAEATALAPALRGAPLVFADVLVGDSARPGLRWDGSAGQLAALGRLPGVAGLRLVPADPARDLAPLLAALPPVRPGAGSLRQRLGLPPAPNRNINVAA